MNADNAMRQAAMTASEYAHLALYDLLAMLDIAQKNEPKPENWQERIIPFVPVWAAMIQAAAQDFHTANISGAVDGSHLPVALSISDYNNKLRVEVEGPVDVSLDG